MKQQKNKFIGRPTNERNRYACLLLIVLFFMAGCRKDFATDNGDTSTAPSLSEAKKTPVMEVVAGRSIQAAINAAPDGAIIKIRPGVYQESITVNKPRITLIGDDQVIIQNPGGASIGIQVRDAGDGFTLKNITIRNFEERGVELINVDGFLLSHVVAASNGEFGLFVQYSSNGTIEHCETTGQTDTGIFVGESFDVTVSQNKSHGNTIGVETENASFIRIDQNHLYDNAAGMLCLLVPGKSVTESSRLSITKNQIRSNNHTNLQTVEGELEKELPSGIGVLILGVNQAQLLENHVTYNKFTGITIVSTLALALLANIPPEAFAGNDYNPDEVRVLSNQIKNNGLAMPAEYSPKYGPFLGFDLLWDGSGTGNCWSKNQYDTSNPSPLPACQ
jgi:parallel beta-helix repeat protein